MADIKRIKLPNGTTYNIKDSAARTNITNIVNGNTKLPYGKSLSIKNNVELNLLDPDNNVLSTVNLPLGGGLPVVEYSTNGGGSLTSGGTVYAPSKSELILLTSDVEFNSSSAHAGFSGGFTLDNNKRNWNHYNLYNATWKTMLYKYCYILARAIVSNDTLTIRIIDTYKLVYTLTSPTAAQLKYYTGGLKYKAASDNAYTEVSSNLDHIDVYDDKVVIALASAAHVQNIQMLMDVTNGLAMALLHPVFLSKDDPYSSGGLYRFSVIPLESASNTILSYKSTYKGDMTGMKMQYIVLEGCKNGFSN